MIIITVHNNDSYSTHNNTSNNTKTNHDYYVIIAL